MEISIKVLTSYIKPGTELVLLGGVVANTITREEWVKELLKQRK